MEELEFRPAERRDLPKMAQLFTKQPRHLRVERMTARYEREPSGWHVATSRGEVVGCCQVVFPRRNDAWLQWMRIAPTVQGGGIGGSFVDYVESRAVKRGAEAIRLNTLPTNERVHQMMGGVRGYTEWARWTRMTKLYRKAAKTLMTLREVEKSTETNEVLDWLQAQDGHQRAFAAATCPSDFRKTVSLDRALLSDLMRGDKSGVMVARWRGGIDGVALYAVQNGELRVLQAVAGTQRGGLAAVAGALHQAKAGHSLSVQVAGCDPSFVQDLYEAFGGQGAKKHDFYVFGKRL